MSPVFLRAVAVFYGSQKNLFVLQLVLKCD